MPTPRANGEAMKIGWPWISLASTSFVGVLSCLHLIFRWGGAGAQAGIGLGVIITFIAHCCELRAGQTRGAGRTPALRRRLLTIELAFGLVTAWALIKMSLN
jgi:hypothetical protein